MHQLNEVDMLSTKLDLLMKKLDDRAGDKKEVMHIYDSHMTCEECGDTGHSGNHCPEMHQQPSIIDVNYTLNPNKSCESLRASQGSDCLSVQYLHTPHKSCESRKCA